MLNTRVHMLLYEKAPREHLFLLLFFNQCYFGEDMLGGDDLFGWFFDLDFWLLLRFLFYYLGFCLRKQWLIIS